MNDERSPVVPKVRTGQTPTELSKAEFLLRWRQRFYDPAFDAREEELKSLGEIAWQNYRESRKSPRTRKAGPGFADAECDLSIEWVDARDKIIAAQKQHARIRMIAEQDIPHRARQR